ncbi:MAG: tetratricopeptide repeat protein [Chloroherpetonaceae bacterium]|nr:tetratricopeptide repeat protein [Chloroherpetonaceae bacterium]
MKPNSKNEILTATENAEYFIQLEKLASSAPMEAIPKIQAIQKSSFTKKSKQPENPQLEADLSRILGNALWRVNRFDEAKHSLEMALEYYLSVNDTRGIMLTKNYLGVVSERVGQYVQALRFFLEAHPLAESLKDSETEAMLLNNIGFSFFHLSDYEASMRYHDRALAIIDKLGNPIMLAATYNNIGNVYAVKSNTDEAIGYFQKSLKLAKQEKFSWGINHGLNQITLELLKVGKLSEAIHYADEAISIAEKSGDERQLATALRNRAESLFRLNHHEEAKRNLQHSYAISEKLNFLENLYSLDILFGDIAFAEEQLGVNRKYDGVHQWYEKALQRAKEMNSKNFESTVHLKLSQWFQFQKNFEMAYWHSLEHLKLEKEMLSEFSQRKLRDFQVLYEVNEFKHKIEEEEIRNKTLTKALQIAEDANKLKNDLLAIAAHDLKNPLQIIHKFATMIAASEEKERILSYSKSIERSSERMLGLVKSLIETAAIKNAHFELNRANFDLALLLEEVIARNQILASEKSQQLLTRISKNVILYADKERIRDCFENLLSNAIKFSPYRSNIHISLLKMKNAVRFSIKDEGPGLSENDKRQLFKEFVTLSAKPTGGESSTGLGLSIVKKVIEAHNGKIWAESEKSGSTFIFDIPKSVDPAINHEIIHRRKTKKLTRSDKSLQLTPKSSGKKITVAIIEDNEDYRFALQETISNRDEYELKGAFSTVEEAEIELKEIDVLLMDIGLPGKSGIDAIRDFKSKSPDCKIILITVFDDETHVSRALIAGANGYLLKKATEKQLFSAIEESIQGGMVMSPEIARKVSDFFVRFAPKESANFTLTRRENEILSLLIDGLSIKQIATKLFISFSTVQNHLAKIYDKMHVNSKSEAVAKALKTGMI